MYVNDIFCRVGTAQGEISSEAHPAKIAKLDRASVFFSREIVIPVPWFAQQSTRRFALKYHRQTFGVRSVEFGLAPRFSRGARIGLFKNSKVPMMVDKRYSGPLSPWRL